MVTAALLAGIEQGRQRRFTATILTLSTSGNTYDSDPGALQQGPLAAGLEAEFYRFRDHAAQFTDLNIYGQHPPATGVLLADVDNAPGYGHLMHSRSGRRTVDKKKPAGNSAGFSY